MTRLRTLAALAAAHIAIALLRLSAAAMHAAIALQRDDQEHQQ